MPYNSRSTHVTFRNHCDLEDFHCCRTYIWPHWRCIHDWWPCAPIQPYEGQSIRKTYTSMLYRWPLIPSHTWYIWIRQMNKNSAINPSTLAFYPFYDTNKTFLVWNRRYTSFWGRSDCAFDALTIDTIGRTCKFWRIFEFIVDFSRIYDL